MHTASLKPVYDLERSTKINTKSQVSYFGSSSCPTETSRDRLWRTFNWTNLIHHCTIWGHNNLAGDGIKI
eukprot:1159282-Pelagomonas_calceolata.AAC.2